MENSYKGHDIEMMFTKIIGKDDFFKSVEK